MPNDSLLALVVKLTYPRSSLTEDEQYTYSSLTRYLYFYGHCDDYEERMKKVWRPGAKAQLITFKRDCKMNLVADKERGVWKKRL